MDGPQMTDHTLYPLGAQPRTLHPVEVMIAYRIVKLGHALAMCGCGLMLTSPIWTGLAPQHTDHLDHVEAT